LIEVLVVIGIILLLTGITLSLVTSARGRAKLTSCASNLGQVGKAMLIYAGEHGDMLPPIQTYTSLVEVRKGEPLIRIAGSPERWVEVLLPYAGSPDVFFCPADSLARTGAVRRTIHETRSTQFTSYESLWFLPPSQRDEQGLPRVSISNLEKDLPIATDITLQDPRSRPEYQTVHGEWSNAVYADGRVETSRIDQ
jgi:prepilin-type processing-associated H-X9-DG protein